MTILTFLASLFNPPLKVEVEGICWRVEGIDYRSLHRRLAQMPGVTFDRKPRYFWSGGGVCAEFVFKGHAFLIESDPFDSALWISPKDELAHPAEMEEIREHLERPA